MNLSEDVDLEDYVSRPEKISGAEISCIVQEPGMQAVRNNRCVVLPKDFEKGYKANTQKNDKDFEFYKWSPPHREGARREAPPRGWHAAGSAHARHGCGCAERC